MKTHLYILASGLVCCMAFQSSGILAKLGMQEETARLYILRDFTGRFATGPIEESEQSADESDQIYNQAKSFQIPSIKLATVITGDKKALAQELCEYVKAYVNSAEFAAAYHHAKESAKPTSEPYTIDPAELAELKASVKEMEKQYAELKSSGQVPEATLKPLAETITQMKGALAVENDPTPNKTRWNKIYPDDPAVVVKARLKEYLQLVATVDFNAKLTGTGNNKKFVNAEYEKKSLRWKAIYRAGKDVNDVATAFAKKWLEGEIIRK